MAMAADKGGVRCSIRHMSEEEGHHKNRGGRGMGPWRAKLGCRGLSTRARRDKAKGLRRWRVRRGRGLLFRRRYTAMVSGLW